MRKFYLMLAALFLTVGLSAQMPPQLPLDPKVKTGTLENGLTYFVVQNNEPKGQGEFYIVQKVGSILEEENQRGLAHFLEHMAFNGTTNFPGNSLIEKLEKIGVKFGANLNAYTAIDETVYNISTVPTDKEENIDMALLILHDWSHELLLEEEEIDNERGVIREELRTRANAQQRMMEEFLPIVLPDNKYAHRLPGGLVEVVDNFEYDELRDYYRRWYRPDQQGIVVVGDFDAEEVEQKIIALFSPIEMPENAPERTIYNVEDHVEPLIAVTSDPEATSTNISIYYKKDQLPRELRSTISNNVMSYMNAVVRSMLSTRLSEIAQQPNAPFLGTRIGYGSYVIASTKDAFTVSLGMEDSKIHEALEAVMHEVERMKRYGFTHAEYERVKASLTSSYESMLKEKDKLSNSYYVRGLVDYFINGNILTSVDLTYEIAQQLMAGITLEQVNQYAATLPTEENMALILMMPEKEGVTIPTEEQLLATYNQSLIAELEPYEEEEVDYTLIDELPAAGTVVAESVEPIGNSTVWTLSNGATVVLMETDFKEDQIIFSATSKGGTSLLDQSDVITPKVISDLSALGGLGKFNGMDLGKALAGKSASVGTKISTTTETVSGNAVPKDAETLFELIHLVFTDIRKDEDLFTVWKTRLENQLKNQEGTPGKAFREQLTKTLYGDNPHTAAFTIEDIAKVDYDKVVELAQERFSNAADFTFIFVGNVDKEALKPLAEKYIASLPGDVNAREEYKVINHPIVKGKVTNEFDQKMKDPKATIYSIYHGDLPYSLENRVLASVSKQVFDMIFTRTIREEEQGTYGVSVGLSTTYYPEERFTFSFNFDTDVPLKDRLLARAYTEIDNVIENGIETTDLDKVMEYMNKNYETSLRSNNYWLGILNTKYLRGTDNHTPYKEILDSITVDKVNAFIREIFKTENRAEVIMMGQPE